LVLVVAEQHMHRLVMVVVVDMQRAHMP